MTKVFDFVKANKGKITLGVVFVLGGLKAVGYEVPEFVVDALKAVGVL